MNNAKITTKLCVSSWFDKNHSLKQTDRPALLSKAGTNAVWASKLQYHKTVSSGDHSFFAGYFPTFAGWGSFFAERGSPLPVNFQVYPSEKTIWINPELHIACTVSILSRSAYCSSKFCNHPWYGPWYGPGTVAARTIFTTLAAWFE